MQKFVKAIQGSKNSVIYFDSQKNRVQYSGGSRTWRNNNPGNLVPGKVSKRNGEIGKAGGFAVFPDIQSGRNALIDSLKSTYGDKCLEQMIHNYAPENENDTKKYLKFIQKMTGVYDSKKIQEFSNEEFEKLRLAIEKMEGWKEGSTQALKKQLQILKVRKGFKGIITSYLIEDIGWVSKEEGIKLALTGTIDAVVATSPRGNPYLRTRPDLDSENNLENRG